MAHKETVHPPCPRCGHNEHVCWAGLRGKKIGERWCARPYGCGRRWIPGEGVYPYEKEERG